MYIFKQNSLYNAILGNELQKNNPRTGGAKSRWKEYTNKITAGNEGVSYTPLTAAGTLTSLRCTKAKVYENLLRHPLGLKNNCEFRKVSKSVVVSMLASVLSVGMISESWAYTKRVYDDYGNVAMQYDCTDATNCTPSTIYNITYDENGNQTSQRTCNSIDSSGKCTAYSSSGNYDYIRDVNGYILSKRTCSSIDSSGNCTAYSSGEDYTRDTNGNQLSKRTCSSIDSSGNCTAYSSGEDYTYDANGRQISQKNCSSYDSSGNCTAYSYANTSTYDGNTRQSWVCNNSSLIDSSGNCTAYSSISYATYDTKGNMISYKGCDDSSKMDSSGNCTSYSYRQEYVYDANGNQTSFRRCSNSNVNSSGNCTNYDYRYDYTYDENGKQTSQKLCFSEGLNANGSCIEYSSETYYTNEYTEAYSACTNRVNGKCETCGGGYYTKSGTCVSSTTGCGEGYTADNDTMQCVKNSSGNPSQDEPVVEDPQEPEEPQVSGSSASAADCAASGKYWQEGKCVSSCGASFKLNDGWCDRQRYTPAKAAAILNDDDNTITITFKK